MSGFTDLVKKAQPAIVGGGVAASGSAGRTWRWRFVDVNDDAGNPINLASITGVCKLVTGPGGTDILALTFTGGLGEFTVSATKAATAGLFSGGNDQTGLRCSWYLTLDDGTDSVQVWMVDNSQFSIRRGA